MSIYIVRQAALLVLCAGMALGAQEAKRGREKAGAKQPSQNSTCNDVPAHPLDLILGRPTRESVTLSVFVYAKQDLDGIVYQEVPQPGTPGQNKPRTATEYGYKSGVILGSPGHLRVRVAPAGIAVDYVRASLPDDERSDRRNAAVGHSYMIPATPVPAR